MNEMLSDYTFNENSLSREERLKLFNYYQSWFDSKGFLVHWDSVEFIKKHIKLGDADDKSANLSALNL